jgi:hypothetical protein
MLFEGMTSSIRYRRIGIFLFTARSTSLRTWGESFAAVEKTTMITAAPERA